MSYFGPSNARFGVGWGIETAAAAQAQIAQAVGSAFGNTTVWDASVRAAFDSEDTTPQASAARSNDATRLYAGKDYGASPKVVTGFKIFGTSNSGVFDAADPTLGIELRATNVSASAPGSANTATGGTLLGVVSATDENSLVTANLAISNSTSYQFVWVTIPSYGASFLALSEIQFFETP